MSRRSGRLAYVAMSFAALIAAQPASATDVAPLPDAGAQSPAAENAAVQPAEQPASPVAESQAVPAPESVAATAPEKPVAPEAVPAVASESPAPVAAGETVTAPAPVVGDMPASADAPAPVAADPTPVDVPASVAATPAPEQPLSAAPSVAEQPAAAPVAPTQSVAEQPTPAAVPAVPVQAVAERMAPQIRTALDSLQKSELPKGLAAITRKQREAVAAFYGERANAPVWIGADGQWTPAARGALARLAHADEDALDLRLGSLPILAEGDDAARATIDVALSMAIAAYAREASEGRVDPRTISNLIDDTRIAVPPARVLAEVSGATDADAALRAFNPPQPGYVALREKLAEFRREKPRSEKADIPAGPVLKVGMRDARVPLVRARFGLDTAAAPTRSDDLVYDTRVAAAIADFQKENGLPASGHLTPRTIAALSGGDPSKLEGEIAANMERWRWMPRQMGGDRIEVNIPDYALKVVQRDEIVHRARVVVGKATTPTPVFSNAMQFIIVNPYWNVPQSIIQKEMMPRLAEDPDYLTKMGYEVIRRKGKLIVRQPPGERNALGRIKFMFPNDHAVYLHDTPSRGLFASTKRAFSHGCVRVDQPLALAETVLGKNNGWSQERFKKLIGGDEKTVKLPTALPIHIEYFTAYVDESGKLQTRDDIYGYSKKVRQALGYQS